tara:strand:+ start:73 stop:360 length:288 start_codon:yes stop_codon:yes gene_type:complete
MRSYELMVIHHPEMDESAVQTAIGELEAAIAESGTVSGSDFWGKRRFAYEIDHIREGYYSVIDFEAEYEITQRISQALALSDAVIRHKIVRSSKC